MVSRRLTDSHQDNTRKKLIRTTRLLGQKETSMPHDHPASDRLITPGLLRPILVDPALNPNGSPEWQAAVEILEATPASITVGRERRLLVSEEVVVDACTDASHGPNGEHHQPDCDDNSSHEASAIAGLAFLGDLWSSSFFDLGGGVVVGFELSGGGIDDDVILVVAVLAEGTVAASLGAAGVCRQRREHLC